MDKLDLALQLTLQALQSGGIPADGRAALGVSTGADGTSPVLLVTVQFTGAIGPLEEAGLQVMSRAGDIATGSIAPENIPALAELDNVVRIEGDLPVEPMLDLSVPETKADEVNSAPGIGTPPTTYTGNGVIVGIIDSGTDYRHESFLNAAGGSRILRIWDQNLPATGAETAPQPFGYGVEYDRAAIDAALGSANPLATVRHQDTNGHGTHVAGIAAGSSPTFPGVAPGADLIVVHANLTRVNTTNAIQYILETASGLNRPCVVNQSQGFLRGPHDGTTLTELFIDRALGRSGQAYIVAAGNFATDNVHHDGQVPANGSTTFQIDVTPPWGSASLEVWYRTGPQMTVSIADPAGTTHGPHPQPAAGTSTHNAATAAGTAVQFGFETDYTPNHHNQIMIRLTKFTNPGVDPGTWTVTLTNPTGQAVDFDAFLERSPGKVGFVRPAPPPGESAQARARRLRRERAQSVSMPGTAREAISVGSYVTRVSGAGTPVGEISGFSSHGPTRDGRIKPDLSAPGEIINSARAGTTNGYTMMAGTSMATPHVAGAVALLLEKRPTLTQEQVRAGLTHTARADARTGTGSAVPNNVWGHGKLDVRALLEYGFPAHETRTWVRVRSTLYNWTEGDTPPSFEVISNENGRAVIELAWGSSDIPTPPALDPAAPLRYYNTGEALDVTVTKADGSSMPVQVPEQDIRLTGNRATWTMPQVLWDGYREELRKARQSPPQSQMRQMLYYRVRFEPTGAASAVIWPDDSSFNASPLNNRMNIIALSSNPITQVAPDRQAVEAMPRHASELDWMWRNLPEDNADRLSLANLFSHRFFTNQMETEIRGKLLTLWVEAGPARQRLHTLLDRQFRTASGLEMTVFKQPCIREQIMLIDHLLELVSVIPHPDIAGVRVAEHLLDDVLQEIMDPNGQMNQGQASTCAPTGIQTLLINVNAAEYARLMRGLLSVAGQATLANDDVVTPPPGIFRAALYAGAQSSGFYVRTNCELAFQSTVLKYARGGDFPRYDPDAPPNDPRGINTVFQATIARGLTFDQIETALEGLFGTTFNRAQAAQPTAALRNQFVDAIVAAHDPLLTVLHWGAATSTQPRGLHAVVSLRHESGRLMFKNPQYAGSGAPATMQPNSTRDDPPRRLDDPSQALESMGDDDLAGWLRAYYHA